MIIGVDIDDTISNTTEIMFNCAQKFVVEDLKKEPIILEGPSKTHHFIEYVHKMNEEEQKAFFEKYYAYIVENVVPKTFSVEYIKKLKEEGNKVVLITARFGIDKFNIEESTKNWLKKWDIPYDNIIFNAETKLKAAKENNVEVFVDDSYSHCKELSKNGIKAFLMDSRGNRGIDTEGFERVYSWSHLYYKLNK